MPADTSYPPNTMARMHSRAKGKSGSTNPIDLKKKSWVGYKESEIEGLVVKLAKQGMTASMIGLVLRDTYGIPSVQVMIHKSINQITKEKGLTQEIPEDLLNLLKQEAKIIKHFERNKQDKDALRGLQLTESKINRLSKYYKRIGRLPKNWTYDPTKIGLLIS